MRARPHVLLFVLLSLLLIPSSRALDALVEEQQRDASFLYSTQGTQLFAQFFAGKVIDASIDVGARVEPVQKIALDVPVPQGAIHRNGHQHLFSTSIAIINRKPYLLLMYLVPAEATTIYVSVAGNDAAGCGTSSSPCQSLYAAIHEAVSNDIISLGPGTFVEPTMTVTNMTLSIIGSDEDLTMLSCANNSTSGLIQISDSNVTLSSLSVQDCHTLWPTVGAIRVEANSSLTISNVNFINNSAVVDDTGGGAAISVGGAILASNCTFSSNSILGSVIARGGSVAIWASSPNATFIDCSFQSNTAKLNNQSGVGAFGGAISSSSSNVNYFLRCNFSNNSAVALAVLDSIGDTAQGVGGAISMDTLSDLSSASVGLLSCTFLDNIAQGRSSSGPLSSTAGGSTGGAISFVGEPFFSRLVILNCSFIGNKALGGDSFGSCGIAEGGAIFAFQVALQIGDCHFYRNVASSGRGQLFGQAAGGGMYAVSRHGGRFDVLRCAFFENWAETNMIATAQAAGLAVGGGLSLGGYAGITIDRSTFVANYVNNSLVGGTGSTAQGGGANLAGDVVAIRHSEFRQNSALAGRSDNSVGGSAFGGAICNLKAVSSLEISDSYFWRNSACGASGTIAGGGGAGGALGVASTFTNITRSEFMHNTATGGRSQDLDGSASGGALWFDTPPTKTIEWQYIVVSHSRFTSNCVRGGPAPNNGLCCGGITTGGAIAASAEYSHMDIRASNFSRNSAIALNEHHRYPSGSAGGGAVFAMNASISDSLFEENLVHSEDFMADSGAVCVVLSLAVSASQFISNRAQSKNSDGRAGALRAYDRTSLDGITFVNNSASTIGGAVVRLTINMIFTNISNCEFNSNQAPNGGALFIDQENNAKNVQWSMTNTSFIENQATHGGAIFVDLRIDGFASHWRFENITSHNNSATAGGGGVYCGNSTPPVWMNDLCAEMSSNTATYGSQCATTPVALNFTTKTASFLRWPGQSFDLSIFAQDHFLNVVNEPSVLQFQSTDDQLFRSGLDSNVISSLNGSFIFQNVYFYGSGQSSLPINVTALVNITNLDLTFTWPFTLIPTCPPSWTSILTGNLSTCIPCKFNSYNLDGQDCIRCPNGESSSTCLIVTESSNFTISPGIALEDNLLLSCPFTDACLGCNGGLQVVASRTWQLSPTTCRTCKVGYKDRLCSHCDCQNETLCYFATDSGCEQCESNRTMAIIALAIFILSLFILITFHRSSLALLLGEACVMVIFLIFKPDATWFLEAFILVTMIYFLLNRSVSSGILKTFLFLLQTTPVIVPSSLWPNWWPSILKKLSIVNLHFWGIECLSPHYLGQVTSPLNKLILELLLPIIIIAFVSLVIVTAKFFKSHVWRWLLTCMLKIQSLWHSNQSEENLESDNWRDILGDKEPRLRIISKDDEEEPLMLREPIAVPPPSHQSTPQTLFEKITGLTLFLLFASYFELTNIVLSIFAPCKEGYMAIYPWISCNSMNHTNLMILAVIFAVIYILGIPALFAYLLFKNRSKIHHPDHAHRLEHWMGFLYECYRDDVYWFEIIWMARRLLLAIASSILVNQAVWSSCLIIVTLVASLLLHVNIRPFASNRENHLELLSTTFLLMTYSIGLASVGKNLVIQIMFLGTFSGLCLWFLLNLVSSTVMMKRFLFEAKRFWHKIKV